MKKRVPYFALLCAAIAAAALTLAWKQHLELIEVRARLMGTGDSADLDRRLRETERRNHSLAQQLVALQARTADAASESAQHTDESARRDEKGSAAPRDPLGNPQVQAMRSQQLKASLDGRYGALFRQMNLPPEKLDQFKTLLAERQATLMDVMMAAREQGLNPRENPEAVRALLAEAQRGVDSNLRTALGDAAYSEFQAFEKAAPQRSVISQLEQKLSYTDGPLSSTQADQLLKILTATTPADYAPLPVGPGYGGGPGMGLGLGFGGGPGMAAGGPIAAAAPITAAAIAQAQPLLNEKQMAALVELQQQQQNQQQLLRAVDGRAAQPGNPGGTTVDRRGGD